VHFDGTFFYVLVRCLFPFCFGGFQPTTPPVFFGMAFLVAGSPPAIARAPLWNTIVRSLFGCVRPPIRFSVLDSELVPPAPRFFAPPPKQGARVKTGTPPNPPPFPSFKPPCGGGTFSSPRRFVTSSVRLFLFRVLTYVVYPHTPLKDAPVFAFPASPVSSFGVFFPLLLRGIHFSSLRIWLFPFLRACVGRFNSKDR